MPDDLPYRLGIGTGAFEHDAMTDDDLDDDETAGAN